MRALRYEVRCSSGIHATILPPPSGLARARPRGEPTATDAPPGSKRLTMRASPPPPSGDGTPMSEEEEATASTIPAPSAVLIESTVDDNRSSIVPPPLSGDRETSLVALALAILNEAEG